MKYKYLNIITTLISVLILSIFSFYILKLNIIPLKYLIVGYIIIILILTGLFLLLLKIKNKILKIIAFIFIIIFDVIFMYGTIYLKNTYDFLVNSQNKFDTLSYSVVVLKESDYKKIEDLKNKEISYLKDNHLEIIQEKLKQKIKYEESISEDLDVLLDNLLNKEVDAIVLEDGYLSIIDGILEDFNEKTTVIYSFDFKTEVINDENDVNVITEPFILYISGIDKYGDVTSVRGRSDVNQLVVVNPKTYQILLVNTPRDYYVQLAGTTGLRDKLTHAGIYGIDKSIKTLENFYDIDINYYLRVNFNTVIKLVDVIGGIEVYSDKKFRSYHIPSWTVQKGINYMDGKKALAYARERFAYVDGDHHRGRNQQQVITAIIDKVTNSKVLISKYNEILNTLEKSFQTDMDMDLITSFIRFQLDEMPKWEVESIQVTGYNSNNYTYSMGMSWYLYVMEPNYDSVNQAKKRIGEILNAS